MTHSGRTRATLLWTLMVGLVALVAGGGALLWRPTPATPRGAQATIEHSSRIVVESPLGDILAPPTGLRWAPVTGAMTYDVQVSEVDGTVLWRAYTPSPSIPVPLEIAALALPAKTLVWRVIAKGIKGHLLAESGPTRFRVRPPEP